MVRIFCSTHDEADAVWRLYQQAHDISLHPAEIWVGDCRLAQITSAYGLASALHEDPLGHTCHPVALADG
jgi:hypothetical protein